MQLTYQNLTLFNEEKIQSVAKIAVMLAKHLLLDRLLTPTPEHHAERASAFIEQNLSSPLSIQRISRGVGTSKSVLYKAFHTAYGCTIGEFVNQKRVEKAAELLNSTALSLDEVALQVGYSSAAYFSRTFKRIKGVSPLRFKKQHA
jgi:AraC-like DNA-binding protein